MDQFKKLRFIFRAWRYRYRLDKNDIKFLLGNLKPGDIAVDVGAHKGGYSYWMHKAVGKSGRVFTFEPQPQLAEYLISIKKLLNMANLTVNNLGISSRSGILTLVVPGAEPNPGATFEAQRIKRDSKTYEVEVETLDNYFKAYPGLRVRLIKCDVEGHELEVFRGGERLLLADKPILMFECEEKHHSRYSSQDVFLYLRQLGYTGYFFRGEKLTPIEEFDILANREAKEKDYVYNFIFLPLASTSHNGNMNSRRSIPPA